MADSTRAEEPGPTDVELLLMRAVTTRLPCVPGSGRLPNLLRRVYARKPRRPVVAKVRGFLMQLWPDQFVDGWLLFGPQFWDDPELKFMERHLPRGGTFVDAGAYLGLYALVASRAVGPSGRVLALEPNPQTFEKLAANLARNRRTNARALHVGVSDREDVLLLAHITDSNTSATSFIWHGTELEIGDGLPVRCRPLLDIMRDEGFDRLDGLKLDIEGFEFRVLNRFFRTAEERLFPRFVIVEHIADWVTNDGRRMPEWAERVGGDTLKLLSEHGYRPIGHYNVNYIFVRNE